MPNPAPLREPSLVYHRLGDLVPWDGNPRTHSEAQVAMLEKSLDSFGLGALPIVQRGTGKVIAGHGRRLALLKRNGPDYKCPCLEMDVDDVEALGYAIADNRLQELSEWDSPLLKAAIAELDNGSFDLEAIGFTPDAISDLLHEPNQRLRNGADPDDAPPLPTAPTSKLGDLYILGDHRLLCGDSTSLKDWDRLMDGQKADLVVTDPPYGVAYESSAADLKSGGKASIQNDALAPAELELFLKAAFLCAVGHSNKRAAFYVFYPSRFHREFENALNHAGLEVRAQIIWAKNAASFGFAQYKWKHEPVLLAAQPDETPLIYVPAHETAFYAFQKKSSPLWDGDRSQTTVWSVARETGYVHLTQKPIELIKKPILNSSKARMRVVDPFGGSGSTLMTCEVTGRCCYSMELDPAFVDVIVKRWEDATGRTAIKAPREE